MSLTTYVSVIRFVPILLQDIYAFTGPPPRNKLTLGGLQIP
jgi:hypothetical protein